MTEPAPDYYSILRENKTLNEKVLELQNLVDGFTKEYCRGIGRSDGVTPYEALMHLNNYVFNNNFYREYIEKLELKISELERNKSKCIEQSQTIAQLTTDKNRAYEERNRLVALLTTMFPSGKKRTDIPGWGVEWHGCVFIDLPTGQVSWHYHDSQGHLFSHLPMYGGEWDGHTSPEKYRRIEELVAANTGSHYTKMEPVDLEDIIDELPIIARYRVGPDSSRGEAFIHIIRQLPDWFHEMSVAIDDDGDLDIEWSMSRGNYFSMFITASGEVGYAALLRDDKEYKHMNGKFLGNIPEELMNFLNDMRKPND